MLINSKTALKVIVSLVDKEKELQQKFRSLSERMETAENLQNMREMKRIEKEGMKFEMELNMHIASKVTAITMVLDNCPDFQNN